MKALIQRVSSAEVIVDGDQIGAIDQGLVVLLGVERQDTVEVADRLLQKIVRYRVFSDSDGHMNLSVTDIAGSLLVVSQFTLAADTQKGLRPSFSSAMSPELAERLYDHFVQAAGLLVPVQQGQFGATMSVSLINEGTVTFMLSAR